MQLDKVQCSAHQLSDVGILVVEQLEHHIHDLGLLQHQLPRDTEEQQSVVGVENLLYHLIILLLGSQHVVQGADELRASDSFTTFFILGQSGHQHDGLEDQIILTLASEYQLHEL